MNRHAIVLLLTLGLAACAWQDRERGTLASLRPPPPTTLTEKPVDNPRNQALYFYSQLIATDPTSPLSLPARRRQVELIMTTADESLIEDPQRARELYQVAVQQYEALLTDDAEHGHSDGALYRLARAYEQSDAWEAALTTLERLAERYPSSPYVAEAHFRRGEMLFSAGLMEEAGAAYRRVTARGESTPLHEQALFKLGWSHFKAQHYPPGLDAHTTLLARKLTPLDDDLSLDALPPGDRSLVDETLRAINLSLDYQGGVTALRAYLAQRETWPHAALLYSQLGDFYLRKERYQDAADSYRAYIDRTPLANAAPLLQAKVIQAYETAGFRSKALLAKQRLLREYGLEQAYWQQGARPAAARELIAEQVTELAGYHHARAQRDHNRADYATAVNYYRDYLRWFPHEPRTVEMNFLLAEALSESDRHAEAVSEYERSAYDYPLHPRAAEAAYAALLAYEAHAAQLPHGATRDTWRRRGIASGLRYAERFPSHPQAANVLTRNAVALWELGEPEAAERAARSVTEHPLADNLLTQRAWAVRGHIAFDRSDYQTAEAHYRRALATLASISPLPDSLREPKVAIRQRLAASLYKQGEVTLTQDAEAAAELFLRAAAAAPGTAIAAHADFDAAAALMTAQAWAQAAAVLETFARRYPGHSLQLGASRKLAIAYQESDATARAAAAWERLGREEDSEEARRLALLQAATLYRDLGKQDRHQQILSDYIRRYPAPLDMATEARFELADADRNAGRHKQAQTRLREIMATTAAGEIDPRTRHYAARAALLLADYDWEAYRGLKLTLPLERSLRAKKSAFENALAAYQGAAAYRMSETTTAATFRLGELYRDFSQALLSSERPNGLSALEREQYDILLEEQAFPFEEQAIDLHVANARRTLEGVYDHWVQESYIALSGLLPARYAKYERTEDVLETSH